MTTEYRGFVFFGQGPIALSAFKRNVDTFMTWCERIGADPADDDTWASYNEMMANSR